MADQPPKTGEANASASGGGLPWGLLLGVGLGVAIGVARDDIAMGAGLAVAFGISFSFLSPLVRNQLNKNKSDGAAEDSDSASSQETDSQ